MKRKLFVFVCAVLFLTSILALAHPGSLDDNGGHWDRKNGTYHYHFGGNAVQPRTYYNHSTPSENVITHDYIVTYDDSYDEGYDEGYDVGYADGLTDGETIYYEEGYDEGYDTGYDAGHDTGHDKGYDEGYGIGYDRGYDEGYLKGEEKGIKQQSLFDKFLMYYMPISIIVIIFLLFKAFSK